MSLQHLARNAMNFAEDSKVPTSVSETSVPGLGVYYRSQPTSFDGVLYNPVACLILQGAKELRAGDLTVNVQAGQSMVISHDVPVMARTTEAPHLSVIVLLDMDMIRSLHDTIDPPSTEEAAEAIAVGTFDDGLLNALERYLGLNDTPEDIPILSPLILKEIHYRLLRGATGAMLRRLITRDSHASRIAKAIELIRNDFRGRLAVPEIANAAGMSASSFHEHFRSITGTTPLRYQKDLRLMEARRLLIEEGHSVSTAAFDVGYESATQFSREYSRKFGASPRTDLRQVQPLSA